MISEVFNMDCVAYMQTLTDKFFDLAIADPPYGIGAPMQNMGSHPNRTGIGKGGGVSTSVKCRLNAGSGKLKNRILNKSNINWDVVPSDEYFNQLFRVSKNQIICGGNYFKLPPTRGVVFWDKLQPWDNFSQFELIWTSFDSPAAKVAISTTGGANRDIKIHPTQKPISLYKWLIEKYAKAGDKIFDSHMGSQSSRIAAFNMGFDYWGCELDEEYFNEGNKRFERETMQQSLFMPASANIKTSKPISLF